MRNLNRSYFALIEEEKKIDDIIKLINRNYNVRDFKSC